MCIQTTTTVPDIPSEIITTTTPFANPPGVICAMPQTLSPYHVPNATEHVLEWIKKAITSHLPPYSYLSLERNHEHLDKFDDNLAAAERYFEGYDGNYNEHFIVGSFFLKEIREVHIGDFRPFEKIFGRNGSKSPEFVTRWGMLGIFDKENGITPLQRVQRGEQ